MKPKIYLCGKMSGLDFDVMNNWRLAATELLKENFIVVNPCDYFNFGLNGVSYTDIEAKNFDLYLLHKSDILLANLECPDTTGSAIEMHMSYEEWKIPVIAYGGEYDKVHPWMRSSITRWCKTFEEAVDHINTFYLPNITG